MKMPVYYEDVIASEVVLNIFCNTRSHLFH